MEARGEGNEGLNLVLTVIWNRAAGLPEFLADKCLERKQFSCWNELPNKTPGTYVINFPKSVLAGKECSTWNKCQELATNAVEGTFTPVNDYWNSYYNPHKCNPDWGSQLTNATVVGHHRVGSLREWRIKANRLSKSSLNKGTGNKTYVVKKGDSIWKIAKNNGITVNQLKTLNNLSSDRIQLGQTLKVG